MDKKFKFSLTTAMVIFSLILIAGFLMTVYGFVDGSNNGKDDVEEWENSMDYRLGGAYQDDDKLNRQVQCDIFNGIWNNTAGGSCKYTQGNNTCVIPTNGPPRCGSLLVK